MNFLFLFPPSPNHHRRLSTTHVYTLRTKTTASSPRRYHLPNRRPARSQFRHRKLGFVRAEPASAAARVLLQRAAQSAHRLPHVLPHRLPTTVLHSQAHAHAVKHHGLLVYYPVALGSPPRSGR